MWFLNICFPGSLASQNVRKDLEEATSGPEGPMTAAFWFVSLSQLKHHGFHYTPQQFSDTCYGNANKYFKDLK